MNLTPLTNADEIRRAYDGLVNIMIADAEELEREVGYQGGGGRYPVHWRSRDHMWSLTSTPAEANRYWCCFGTEDPTVTSSLTISAEINPPREGINRRCAGVFAADDRDEIYLTHSGRVGGGRKGIGKANFARFNQSSERVKLNWPDGRQTDAFLVGRLGDPRVPTHVADYVRTVERFKRNLPGA